MHVLEYLRDPGCARRPQDSCCADYRLLCSGIIYRETGGEWYKSEAARFLLARPLLLYAASRPFDKYPLELVLRLTVPHVEETEKGQFPEGMMAPVTLFYPDKEVARDLAALLTMLCRRLITVMGKSAERLADYEYPEFERIPQPVRSMSNVYWPFHPAHLVIGWNSKDIEDYNPQAKPIDPGALTALLLGLPQVAHAESIVASARLYALALELIHDRQEIAYQLLVSSVETIASETLPDPEDDEKARRMQQVSDLAKTYGLEEAKARNLAITACNVETRWPTRKFKKFLTDNTDDRIWEEDDLYRVPLRLLPRRENFQQTLGKIYTARSDATHSGQQFPVTASYSGRPELSTRVAMKMFSSDPVFPPVVWFERVVNVAITTYWERAVSAFKDAG
jgi:hypothetical protein